MGNKKNHRRSKSSNKKKNPTAEQSIASSYVRAWALGNPIGAAAAADADGFLPPLLIPYRSTDRVVFDLHSHSKFSDGFLSPSALVERAHRKGVKVLALTDHDTMAGIPEAVEAANKFGMRIIPGVEISALYSPREGCGLKESVHILAYYGSCGPARYEEVESMLTNIRDGRYKRAKNMLLKLNKLKMPLKWEHIARIAGNGVAPGRVHVARAMVEAGHVENLKQAFSRYLYDGGPAYCTGSEPSAESVVQLIQSTGGVAALAHPWTLKNPVAVIMKLKAAGLHAMEVYRTDGKFPEFSDIADTHELLKIGGSDFHGRGGHDESDLGSVSLPIQALFKFLELARPIWCEAVQAILESYAEEPSDANLQKMARFGKPENVKGHLVASDDQDVVDLCLSSWLATEERESVDIEAIKMRLFHTHRSLEEVVSNVCLVR